MTIAKAPFVAYELNHLLFATFPCLVIRKDLTQGIRRTSKAAPYMFQFILELTRFDEFHWKGNK